MRWRSVRREALVWRELDGELALRNGLTGSTHLLGRLPADALRALVAEPAGLTAVELAALLGGATAGALQDVLVEFERLGLAERIE